MSKVNITGKPGVASSGRVSPLADLSHLYAGAGPDQQASAIPPNPAGSIAEYVKNLPTVPPLMKPEDVPPDAMVGPEDYQGEPVDPGLGIFNLMDSVNNPVEAAQAANSKFAPLTQKEYAMQGEDVLFDPETNQPILQPLPADVYNKQFELERKQKAIISDPFGRLVEDPTQPEQAIADLMNISREQRIANGNRRWIAADVVPGEQASPELEKVTADKVSGHGNVLTEMYNNAVSTLFNKELTRVTLANETGGEGKLVGEYLIDQMAARGEEVSAETAKRLAMLGTMAMVSSFTRQEGESREDAMDRMEQGGLRDPQDGPDGTKHKSELINSLAHFIRNGLEKDGRKMPANEVQLMAKALVEDAYRRGDLQGAFDINGRPILQPTYQFQRKMKRLRDIADVVSGDDSRAGASSSPTPSGTRFGSTDKNRLTKRSIKTRGMNTDAADWAKNILGSVKQITYPTVAEAKARQLAMVFDQAQVVFDHKLGPVEGFQYSNHPLAAKLGLSQKHFKAARWRVAVPEGFKKGDPLHERSMEVTRTEAATEIMATQAKKAKADFQNVLARTGQGRYGHYTHAMNNQRLYIADHDLDIYDSKTVIRDTTSLAHQDPLPVSSLFDKDAIARVVAEAERVFDFKKYNGRQVHEMLVNMNPATLSSIGVLHNAVVYYYTAFEPGVVQRPAKLPLTEALKLYTPAIGEKLASLGMKWNKWIADKNWKSTPMDEELMGAWAAADTGEFLGTVQVWSDFARAKEQFDAGNKTATIGTKHHVFWDGNQNGILLQSLLFGKAEHDGVSAITRLTQASPSMPDLREFATSTLVDNQEEYLMNNGEYARADAWKSFWAAALDHYDGDWESLSSVAFKAQLMQNSYGKDAGMFLDNFLQWASEDEKIGELLQEVVAPFYDTGSVLEVLQDLNLISEMTLKQVLDNNSMQVISRVGRVFAMTGNPVIITGPSGDTWAIGDTGLTLINDNTKRSALGKYKTEDGEEFYAKGPRHAVDILRDPQTGEMVALPSTTLGFRPEWAKGTFEAPSGAYATMRYLNRNTMTYDEFHNYLGRSLAKQLAVLMTQSLDGEMMKMTTIEANKDRQGVPPRPVIWVHDSIISTPGQMLIYANLYNNVVIPEATKLMPKIIEQLQQNMNAFVSEAKTKGEKMDMPVGIGAATPDFPVVGAILDEYFARIDPSTPSYKELFFRREANKAKRKKKNVAKSRNPKSIFDELIAGKEAVTKTPEQEWAEYEGRIVGLLKEARSLGWKSPKQLPGAKRMYLAVPPENFPRIFDIARELIGAAGPSDYTKSWFKSYPANHAAGLKELIAMTRKGGIWQQSPTRRKVVKSVKSPGMTPPKAPRVKAAPVTQAPKPKEEALPEVRPEDFDPLGDIPPSKQYPTKAPW